MNRGIVSVSAAGLALWLGACGDTVEPLSGNDNRPCSASYCTVALNLKKDASVGEILTATVPHVKSAIDRGEEPKELLVYVATATVGGKAGGQVSYTCDQRALDQIDWSNVDGDGISQLCKVTSGDR